MSVFELCQKQLQAQRPRILYAKFINKINDWKMKICQLKVETRKINTIRDANVSKLYQKLKNDFLFNWN